MNLLSLLRKNEALHEKDAPNTICGGLLEILRGQDMRACRRGGSGLKHKPCREKRQWRR